jgi:hypothetical protein
MRFSKFISSLPVAPRVFAVTDLRQRAARANPPTGAGSMDFMMKALLRMGKHSRCKLAI